MLKQISKSFIILVVLFVGMMHVSAAGSTCSNARVVELNAIATNIKNNIELFEEKTQVLGTDDEGERWFDITRSTFVVHLTNLTDDVYITVKNNDTNLVQTYRSDSFEDNEISFASDDGYKNTLFGVSVHSADSACEGEVLRRLEITTPVFNRYHDLALCEGAEDFYLCRRVLGSATGMSENQVINSIYKYKDGLLDKDGNEIPADKKKNKWLIPTIIVGSAIVAVGGVIVVMKISKRRKSVI